MTLSAAQEFRIRGYPSPGGCRALPPKPNHPVRSVNNKRIVPRNYSIQAHLSRISAAVALQVHLHMVECTAGMFMPLLNNTSYAVARAGRFGGLQARQESSFSGGGCRQSRQPPPENRDLRETPGTLWVWAPGLPKPLHHVSPGIYEELNHAQVCVLRLGAHHGHHAWWV